MKKIINKVKKTLSLAVGTLDDYSYARKSDKKSRENLKEYAMKEAKKNFKNTTGMEMTPRRLNNYADTLIPMGKIDKATGQYLKDKKSIYKKKKKIIGL